MPHSSLGADEWLFSNEIEDNLDLTECSSDQSVTDDDSFFMARDWVQSTLAKTPFTPPKSFFGVSEALTELCVCFFYAGILCLYFAHPAWTTCRLQYQIKINIDMIDNDHTLKY